MSILKGRQSIAATTYEEILSTSSGELRVKDSDIDTLLTTIDSVLDTIQTNVASLDNIAKASNFISRTLDWSSAITGSALWTPSAGNRIVITDLLIGIETECLVTVFQDTDSTSNRICKFSFVSGGGTVINFTKPRWCTTDKVVKVTTSHGSSTPNGYITAIGFEV